MIFRSQTKPRPEQWNLLMTTSRDPTLSNGCYSFSSNDQRVHKGPGWTVPLHQLTASAAASWQQVAENFQYFITHSRGIDSSRSAGRRTFPSGWRSKRVSWWSSSGTTVASPWTNCSRHDSRRPSLLTIEFH